MKGAIKRISRGPWGAIPRGRVYFSWQAFCRGLSSIFSFSILKGDYIYKYEREFARYIGTEHAIATYSGTTSLRLCLDVIDVKRGDEIICPAYMVPEVVYMLRGYGLKVIFIDIDKDSFNINAALIEEKITTQTKAIIMAHMYGNPCDIDRILDIARENNLIVIEDCAQACGAEYKSKKIGGFGDLAYFSFGLMKNVNTFGGGMITTSNNIFAYKIRDKISRYKFPFCWTIVRKFVWGTLLAMFTNRIIFTLFVYPFVWLESKLGRGNLHEYLRGNKVGDPDMQIKRTSRSRLRYTNMQAGVGLVQMIDLHRNNDLRRQNAQALNGLFRDADLDHGRENPDAQSIFINYVVLTDRWQQIKRRMLTKGVDLTQGYIESFMKASFAQRAFENNLYIPIYPPLSRDEVLSIGEKIIQIIKTT